MNAANGKSMSFSRSLALVAFSMLMLLSQSAHAGGGVAAIGNATVNRGQLTTQLRLSFSEDEESARLDGRFRNRLMVDYGFTDDFSFGLFLQGDNPGNGREEFDAMLAQARIELTDAKTSGYYSGFWLRYTLKDGDKEADNAHIRFIAGVPLGQWDLRINQIFAYEVGKDSRGGVGIDTRLQATYFYHPDHRAGIESFSDFGYGSRRTTFDEQTHVIGPVFAGKIDDGLLYEVGYQRGLSEAAADNTVKLFITHIY